ncbi:hypothetical protein DXF93_11615 [Escherichia coli]|nr:hypothetical protein DXF93_11615 [Escherichia coli]
MIKTQEFQIYVPQGTPSTVAAFKKLIESHYHLFEDSVLSNFNDTRYTFQGDSLTVTEFECEDGLNGSFTFEVDVQYYEGCKDKDDVFSHEDTVEFSYEKATRLIKFSLDETIWQVDN